MKIPYSTRQVEQQDNQCKKRLLFSDRKKKSGEVVGRCVHQKDFRLALRRVTSQQVIAENKEKVLCNKNHAHPRKQPDATLRKRFTLEVLENYEEQSITNGNYAVRPETGVKRRSRLSCSIEGTYTTKAKSLKRITKTSIKDCKDCLLIPKRDCNSQDIKTRKSRLIFNSNTKKKACLRKLGTIDVNKQQSFLINDRLDSDLSFETVSAISSADSEDNKLSKCDEIVDNMTCVSNESKRKDGLDQEELCRLLKTDNVKQEKTYYEVEIDEKNKGSDKLSYIFATGMTIGVFGVYAVSKLVKKGLKYVNRE